MRKLVILSALAVAAAAPAPVRAKARAESVVKATGVIKPMIGAEVRVGSRISGVGRDAYEVENGNRRYFFDAENGLLVRRRSYSPG